LCFAITSPIFSLAKGDIMSVNPLPNAGNDLLRIHKVITRALDVSLQNSQNTYLVVKHWQGFMTYLRVLTVLLHSHHASEDELSFPFWRTRLPDGPFDELSEQHRQMILYLEQIERWLRDARQESWQANMMSELTHSLTDLRTLWQTHIALEEATIGPENSGKYLTVAENEQLGKQLAEHGQTHAQPSELVMPFAVYNLSGADRAEFVKLFPPVMIQQLIPIAWKAAWEPMIPFLMAE
jgi:hemerythrin-like domain-containing protein